MAKDYRNRVCYVCGCETYEDERPRVCQDCQGVQGNIHEAHFQQVAAVSPYEPRKRDPAKSSSTYIEPVARLRPTVRIEFLLNCGIQIGRDDLPPCDRCQWRHANETGRCTWCGMLRQSDHERRAGMAPAGPDATGHDAGKDAS